MSFLLDIFSKLTGPWGYLMAGLGGALAAGAAAWWLCATIYTAKVAAVQHDFDQAKVTWEKARADGNQKVIDGLNASIQQALAANADALAAAQVRDGRYQKFLKELANAPSTRACASTPAFHALLDSVRIEGAGTGSPN